MHLPQVSGMMSLNSPNAACRNFALFTSLFYLNKLSDR